MKLAHLTQQILTLTTNCVRNGCLPHRCPSDASIENELFMLLTSSLLKFYCSRALPALCGRGRLISFFPVSLPPPPPPPPPAIIVIPPSYNRLLHLAKGLSSPPPPPERTLWEIAGNPFFSPQPPSAAAAAAAAAAIVAAVARSRRSRRSRRCSRRRYQGRRSAGRRWSLTRKTEFFLCCCFCVLCPPIKAAPLTLLSPPPLSPAQMNRRHDTFFLFSFLFSCAECDGGSGDDAFSTGIAAAVATGKAATSKKKEKGEEEEKVRISAPVLKFKKKSCFTPYYVRTPDRTYQSGIPHLSKQKS